MPVTPQDRPIDALREETVDQLIMNYGHGKLSRDAFERRLDEALDTKSHDRLLELTRRPRPESRSAIHGAEKGRARHSRGPTAANRVDDAEHIINVFAGNTRRGAWDVPRVIRMFNLFGGAELDFTDARFTAETTYITVFCLFGGVNCAYATGCARSRRRSASSAASTTAQARLRPERAVARRRGPLLFGGVDIRVKKTPSSGSRSSPTRCARCSTAEPPRA